MFTIITSIICVYAYHDYLHDDYLIYIYIITLIYIYVYICIYIFIISNPHPPQKTSKRTSTHQTSNPKKKKKTRRIPTFGNSTLAISVGDRARRAGERAVQRAKEGGANLVWCAPPPQLTVGIGWKSSLPRRRAFGEGRKRSTL